MARAQRASAAAAAKKISAYSKEDTDVAEKTPAGVRRDRKRQRSIEDNASDYDEDTGDVEEDISEDVAGDTDEDDESEAGGQKKGMEPKRSRPRILPDLDQLSVPPTKRRKTGPTATAANKELYDRLFSPTGAAGAPDSKPLATTTTTTMTAATPCRPPHRHHATTYHRPLLLDGASGRTARAALLAWYDAESSTRGMPWRKPWLDPRHCSREELAVRAYEVWISEIMAQQTRIPVVVAYWTRWMARWPAVEDLAAAPPDDVMAAWRGLGYYSRANRLHAAARAVVAAPDLRGLLPTDPADLVARVPGVGRYTAGAIAAIVFGCPAAMVDGNVVRVLSRQLGLYADSKTDKATVDLLWAAAEALVRAVAADGDGDDHTREVKQEVDGNNSNSLEILPSDRPGRWGQALMELGSTVCTPKPDCAACPIRSTCRAFAEGAILVKDKAEPAELCDLEDICQLCEPFPEDGAAAVQSDTKMKKDEKKKGKEGEATASPFFTSPPDYHDRRSLTSAIEHARLFPLRRPKKAVRAMDTFVCAIRTPDGRYLLHRRPERGLLAGLWQLPSHDLSGKLPGSKAALQKGATAFVERWLAGDDADTKNTAKLRKPVHLGTVPWLFSHIRQTMQVFLFEAGGSDHIESLPTPDGCCWATAEDVEDSEAYTMGTGMRRCWDLVQKHVRNEE
ncbi:hypothetical protein CMQ_6645 [Grosmannia clavigera kw1407]|uniref:Adenine DNA glycosylase n=1 Tax=Grosmannia clavigera (strain kw1407 / UAMH 11150) TaxID=655863 RepID=F0X7P0_GROCL|nr:uncharacterized protein CMQ_6645 [Grosmannia clavigera kw1407]EFX06324.1 hypothetical protein CMQ_6645 [Grosmannia clavigera kw1407]